MKTHVRNSAFNLGAQGLTILAGLACVPIAFRHLGTERFGLLTLVWSTLSYAIVFDLGTGPAVARATAGSLARDNGSRIRAIVQAGMGIQLGLGVAAALIVALLAPMLLGWLNVPIAYRHDGRLALYALALALPAVLLAQSLQAVLEGLERFDLIAYVRTPVAIATYVMPAWGALAHWSLARIMFAILITRVIGVIVLYMLYRATLPANQDGAARVELPGLFRYSRWLAITGVLVQVMMYADRYLLSAMHGLDAVSQYSAPYDAATKLLVLPGAIGVALFPSLAKDHAREQSHDAVLRSRASNRTTMWILLPVCVVLFAFAGPLLHLWLGPQLSAAGVLGFRVLLLATVFHAAAYPPVILIEAFGRSDIIARYHLTELVLYLPVAIYMIGQWGVVGAAAAWALRSLGMWLFSAWYAHKHYSAELASPVYAR